MPHLPVPKTFKLFINGAFPRSESGRSLAVNDRGGRVVAHIPHGSRKDLRDAVEAARAAQAAWADRTAYNRGQILYRMAEMLEGRRDEFAESIGATIAPAEGAPATRKGAAAAGAGGAGGRVTGAAARKEVEASIDRLVCFAGWTDKLSQVLGGHNPVAGPFYNFTVPEATGVTGVLAPDEPALLGLVSLLAPPLCAGNTVVAVAGERHPLPAVLLGEACATADVPAGVVNIVTGRRDELLGHLAAHRDVDAISAANVPAATQAVLKRGTADNLKRVHIAKLTASDWYDAAHCESPWTIEPFVEMKTIWHPSAT